jgi:peptide/nickel transport system substrate-binding protein
MDEQDSTSKPSLPTSSPEGANLNSIDINAPQPTPAPDAGTVVGGPVHTWSGGAGKKLLLGALTLVVLACAGYLTYGYLSKPKPQAQANNQTKKDIASITIMETHGAANKLYPLRDNTDHSFALNNQIYEGLVRYEDGSKIVPALATDWSNPNDTTWDFNLKPNVLFHNGHTMSAEDVVFSVNTLKKVNPDLYSTYGSSIKSVKALSSSKVEIVTDKPDPLLLNKLPCIYVIDSKGGETPNPANGTGPYQLKPGTTPSDQEIHLVAFDKYHDGHVYTRELSMLVKDSSKDAIDGLKNKTVNIAGNFDEANPDSLKGVTTYPYQSNPSHIAMIVPNSLASGPLQKLQVRQALQLSIDISALMKKAGISGVPMGQIVAETIPGYDPSIKVPTRDVAKAKELLKQAGYPNGVTLTLSYGEIDLSLFNELARQLGEAGITLKPQVNTDFDTMLGNMAEGKNQLTKVSFASDANDGGDVFEQVIRGMNNYKNPTLDKYLDDAANMIDISKRIDILKKANKLVADDVAVLPLYRQTPYWLMDKPYVISAGAPGDEASIYFWKVYQE